MTLRWGLWTIGLLSLAANTVGIVQFGDKNPWLYIVLTIATVLAFAFFAFRNAPTFWAVRRLMSDTQAELLKRKIAPQRVIAFDRSSGTFGGMLCQRMDIAELVVLPRKAQSLGMSQPRRIIVGDSMLLDAEALSKDAVVFVYHLRTGATLEAGLAQLGVSGESVPIIALYATSGAIARWPGAIVVRTVRDGYVPNEHLPWMSEPYKHQ